MPDSDINRVEEFTVTIDENSDGVVKEVIANDSPFTAYIKMIKKDKKTGKTVTYSNATFELYKYDRATREWNLVQCKVGSKYYREWTTDENGVCETETTLDSGTYRLVEKVIPKGFNELDDNLIFYVNSMNESVEYDLNWDAWITVEVENEQPTGRLVIDKSILLNEDVDKSLINTSDLSSIKFRLKANENIIDYADGSVIYKKGKTIGEYNVDADGHLEIPELPMGSYTLQEINFLEDGNIIDEWISKKQPHSIEGLTVDKEYILREEISAEGFVKATDIKFTVENTSEMQKVEMKDEQVLVNKIDSDGNHVVGAELQILDKDGNVIDSWTTDGKVHYASNLEEGKTYILKEVKVPDPYVKAADVEFTVPTNKTNLEIEMVDKKVAILKTDVNGNPLEGAELVVKDKDDNILDEWTSTLEEHYIKGLKENESYKVYEKTAPDKYVLIDERSFKVSTDKTTQIVNVVDEQVSVMKVDIDGNILIGAKLQVLDKNENIIDEWISDETAHIISGLKENETYILRELEAPVSYVRALDTEFTVPSDETNLEIKLIDKVVSVKKTDFVTGKEVEGAELEITDKDGNVIDSWVSGKEEHIVTGLIEGETYTLTEKTCPYGYEIAESIEFTVTEDKETQLIEMKDMPILKDLRLTKINSKTKEVIKDKFTFGIYEDPDCTKLIKEVESDAENGVVNFEDLRYGTYYIKEIKAPNGYIISDRVVKVDINDKGVFVDDKQIEENDNIYNFEFENAPIETPNTGDESNLKLIGGIMILSLLGISLLAIKLYKKHKDEK